MRPSRSSGTIASSVATTRELSQRSEQLRVLLVHRTNIPPQFFALDSILSTARLHIAVRPGTAPRRGQEPVSKKKGLSGKEYPPLE